MSVFLWVLRVSVGVAAAMAAMPRLAADDVRPPTVAVPEDAVVESEVDDSGDVFLLTVFSSQTTPKVPALTHNWGVAVRIRETDGEREVVRVDTISWMPRSMQIDAISRRTTPGVNLSHEQTAAHASRTGQRITRWGPLELTPAAYESFLRQKSRLDAGRLRYQCWDTIGEAAARKNGCNCTHALSDFANLLPHSPGIPPYGDESAALIIQRLQQRGLAEKPEEDRSWVAVELGWTRATGSPSRSTTSAVGFNRSGR